MEFLFREVIFGVKLWRIIFDTLSYDNSMRKFDGLGISISHSRDFTITLLFNFLFPSHFYYAWWIIWILEGGHIKRIFYCFFEDFFYVFELLNIHGFCWKVYYTLWCFSWQRKEVWKWLLHTWKAWLIWFVFYVDLWFIKVFLTHFMMTILMICKFINKIEIIEIFNCKLITFPNLYSEIINFELIHH